MDPGALLRLAAVLLAVAAGAACRPAPDGAPQAAARPAGAASEHGRPSMPDSMKVGLEPMPEGPSPDSMAAQMDRAFQGGSP
ncbi:MAG TPA: hypothetical protein VIC56_08895 [Gemmatimonadota bacterium]